MASSCVEPHDWQTTRETIRERNKFMFKNSLLSDMKFVVRDGSDETKTQAIPAHKYVLAISSPVFFAMFYGDLAETGDTYELPDCDSEGLLELLRYIYCDETELTGSNVMQVLYLAKKFIIPSLVQKCTDFLEQNMDADNVFDILPQAKRFDEAQLTERCWKVVDKQADKAVNTKSFEKLDRELLTEVVERDWLIVREVKLFQAVNRWAANECRRRGMEGSGEEKREILGPVLELIRFPLMTEKEFAGVVLLSKVLTLDEVTDVFRFYNALPVTDGLKFSQKPRYLSEVLECKRFATFDGCWGYGGGSTDAISFTINVPIVMVGFRLIGKLNSQYLVNMKLYKNSEAGSEAVIWSRDESYETVTWRDCDYEYWGYDVMFESGILLQASSVYTVVAKINGPNSIIGTKGLSEVQLDNVCITFTMSQRSDNGTNVDNGQFPILFFRRQDI